MDGYRTRHTARCYVPRDTEVRMEWAEGRLLEGLRPP